MAKISLLANTNIDPELLAQHAGRTCYESEVPALEKSKLDVRKQLWETGHHTTWEHWYATFAFEDTSVSTFTYGLHLTHPHYNSDQRSGRYSKMFDEKNYNPEESRQTIEKYFPNDPGIFQAMDMINYGAEVFHANKEKLTGIAAIQLCKERPNVSESYIEKNSKKMAQEQLRAFISTVVPTADDYTMDLVTMAAMKRVAWTPELRDISEQIAAIISANHPQISYIFDAEGNGENVNFCDLRNHSKIKYSPDYKTKKLDIPLNWNPLAKSNRADAVDILKFDTESMDNNLYGLRSEIEVSTMTMGQDQRHRSIGRGRPHITGNFYLPPLLKIARLDDAAKTMKSKWNDLMKVSPDLANFVAPYGAMVRYGKHADLNALLHEAEKRLCWCAQEEIYNLNRKQVLDLNRRWRHDVVRAMLPYCAQYGKCIEAAGGRTCGRDMTVWKNGIVSGFAQRTI